MLSHRDPEEPLDESVVLLQCLALGRPYALQRRVKRQESVSKVLFATALQMATNRGLSEPGPEQKERRLAFAEEIREAIRRVDAIEALVRSRQAGLFG